MSARGMNDVGECAFCGSQCGQNIADSMAAFHAAFERLVRAAPKAPWFNANTPDYVDALLEAGRILDVGVEDA